MIFAPKPLGNQKLDPGTLAQDKKSCRKIGPCGLGEKAMYLNSFYLDRRYYVLYGDVRRVYKRIAMSKGGYTGKGIFASMAYLVVEFSNGLEKQCNFKFEEQVDELLREIERKHPEIKTHSRKADEKLAAAKAAEQARYIKDLPVEAEETIRSLRHAREYLERKPQLSDALAGAARRKRAIDGRKTSIKAAAAFILAISIAALAFGIYKIASGERDTGLYAIMFATAFLFLLLASGVLPSRTNNRKAAQRDWDAILSKVSEYIGSDQNFPVPAQYAHPVVLDRMIRVIREGRAKTSQEALETVKNDLKSLNNTVKVSQQEYEEVVAVKPMFLVMDYR